MLTGKLLGDAIRIAINKKGLSQKEIADAFHVKPPSVAGWIKTGRISKPHFERLRNMLADVVGPAHWGLSEGLASRAMQFKAPQQEAKLSKEEAWLLQAFRKADNNARTAMIAIAKTVLPEKPGFPRRTGT